MKKTATTPLKRKPRTIHKPIERKFGKHVKIQKGVGDA